mgnify:CR=1 FL=1
MDEHYKHKVDIQRALAEEEARREERNARVNAEKTLEGQARQALIRAKIRDRIEKRAREETFRSAPIAYTPPDYVPLPGEPAFVVRAVYGPVSGLTASVIAAFPYDKKYLSRRVEGVGEPLNVLTQKKRLLQREDYRTGHTITSEVQTFALPHDPSGKWGPRQFLHELFSVVALLHGDCTVYMVHSGVEMEIDVELFRQWVEESQVDPAKALLAPLKMLEQKSDKP